MRQTLLANRYAKAFVKAGAPPCPYTELKDFSDLLARTPLLAASLTSPGIPFARKKLLIENLAKSPVIQRLILHLVSKNRLRMLPEIVRRSQELLDKEEGIARAVVRTALPLTFEQKQELMASLKDLIGRNVLIEETPDHELLAGMVVRVGDMVMDNSLKNQLKILEDQLAGRQ